MSRFPGFLKKIALVSVFLMVLGGGSVFASWEASFIRPPVESPRVEEIADSMFEREDPQFGLTKLVEDSLRPPEERIYAATVLAAVHNRDNEPARALLTLFYVAQETGTQWDADQWLIASEAYSRLGRYQEAEDALDRIPYTHSMTELIQTLRIFYDLERLNAPESLIEIRSRFERQLERSSDPMALMLSLHGLGLAYLAAGIPAHDDTAAAYLSFCLDEYRSNQNQLPFVDKLLPYGLYWNGVAATRRGDGWQALASWEEILTRYPQSVFWDEAALKYAALQLKRGNPDSVVYAANLLLDRTEDYHRALEARLLLTTVKAYNEHYAQAATEFAAISRQLPAGDTLRVLSHAGMVGCVVRYSRRFFWIDSVIPALEKMDLAGYNPLAIPEVNCELAERFLQDRRLDEADSFFNRSLRYYPDSWIETRTRLGLATISLADGDWSSCINHYERAFDILDRYDITFDGLADLRFNAGLAYLQRSRSNNGSTKTDLKQAKHSFQQAIALDPEGETGHLARKKLEALD